MRIPDLYLVDDGNAYWLEPSYDYFGDPDVELAGCPVNADHTITFDDGYSVDKGAAEDRERLDRIEAALRAIADNGPDA
jgi:hypothetical protein